MKVVVVVFLVLSILAAAFGLLIILKGDGTQQQLLGSILFVALGVYLLLLANFLQDRNIHKLNENQSSPPPATAFHREVTKGAET